VWRHRGREDVIVVEAHVGAPAVDEDGWVRYVGLLDDFGLLDFGSSGSLEAHVLRTEYRLVSDPGNPDLRRRPPRR
jgi:hypothetical protein